MEQPNPNQEPILNEDNSELVSEIVGHWDVVTANPDDPENPVVTPAYKYSVKRRPNPASIDPELFVRQAPAIHIRPTRRERPESDYFTVLAYGDMHHPFQNDRRLDLAENALKELQPDAVVTIGDDTDMPMQSRFETRQEWIGSTQEGIDRFSERLARIRALIGRTATMHAIEGNHDIRFERNIRENNAELLGIKRANAPEELGVLTLEFLLRCDEIGVEYVRGYPGAELWFGDKLKLFHGRKTGQGVVSKELKEETVSFMHGHGHKGIKEQRTFRDGRKIRTITGMQLGAFALQDAIPSGRYSVDSGGQTINQVQDWQSNLGVAFVPKEGDEEPVLYLLDVNDEYIDIFGRKYRS